MSKKYKVIAEKIKVRGGISSVYTVYKKVLGFLWWPTADYFFDEITANNYINKKNGFQ